MGLCNGAVRWGCRTGLQDVEQDRSCRLGSVQSLCSAAQFPLLACHLEAADSSPPAPHRLRAHRHRHAPRPCLGPVPMSRVALPGGLGTPRSAPAARGAAARGAVRAVGNPPCSPVPDPVPIPRCRAVVARVGRACGGAQGTRAGGKALTVRKQSIFRTSLLLFAWGREVWGGGQRGRIQPWCSLRLGASQGGGLVCYGALCWRSGQTPPLG